MSEQGQNFEEYITTLDFHLLQESDFMFLKDQILQIIARNKDISLSLTSANNELVQTKKDLETIKNYIKSKESEIIKDYQVFLEMGLDMVGYARNQKNKIIMQRQLDRSESTDPANLASLLGN